MAKNVLVVTKDVGEFNVYQPVVRMLREQGVMCTLVTEGLSRDKWLAAGELAVHPGEAGLGPLPEFLRMYHPDLILTGLGAPINLGEQFGLAANQLGIPLGYVHDLWGVHKRSRAVPQFVCVTDEYDARLVREHKPYKGVLNPHLGTEPCGPLTEDRTPEIIVTGSPAMDALDEVMIDGDTDSLIGSMQGSTILLLGQNECTTPMLDGLVAALDENGENYILVPRFHPRFMADSTLRQTWLSLLYGAKKGHVLFVPSSVSTRELMLSVDYAVSVYSTGLIEAAMLGTMAVSWTSNLGRAQMKQALGVERFPLVDMGCAKEISGPDYWKAVWDMDPDSYNSFTHVAQENLRADGKATERVVAAILKHL